MDIDGIKKVIEAYFDAGYASSGAGMAEVFHDCAHLYMRDKDGSLIDWDKNFFVNLVNGESQGKDGPDYPRYNEILAIDFVDENTAVARVKVRVAETLYTDILCFLRLGGKWQIISKVFSGVPAQ